MITKTTEFYVTHPAMCAANGRLAQAINFAKYVHISEAFPRRSRADLSVS